MLVMIDRFKAALNILRFGTPDAGDDFWYGPVSAPTSSGQVVTEENSLWQPTVYACIRVLAEAFASVPCDLFEAEDDRNKRHARGHRLYNTLKHQSNPYQTAAEYWEMALGHAVLRGNAYSHVRLRRGTIELWPIHPDAVKKVEVMPLTGRLRYTIKESADENEREYDQAEIFHIRGLSSNGLVGMSPVGLQRELIGTAKALQQHGGTVFGNQARPGGVFTHPGRLKPEAKENIRQDFRQRFTGANAHETMVLSEGMSWQQVGLSNEDAQFLDTQQFTRSQICGIFRVPCHMVGDLTRATFSNIEHQAIEFVKYSVLPWARKIEEAIRRDLITQQSRFFARFNLDALERGDLKSRYEAYMVGRTGEWLSANDIRVMEDMNEVPGGDVYENPNTKSAETPAEPEPMEPEPVEASANMTSTLETWIDDVSERLAHAEIQQVKKRIGKAGEDRDRFATWATSYFTNGHRDYLTKHVLPIVKAWGAETGSEEDVTFAAECIADLIANRGSVSLTESPQQTYTQWLEGDRATEIKSLITTSLTELG